MNIELSPEWYEDSGRRVRWDGGSGGGGEKVYPTLHFYHLNESASRRALEVRSTVNVLFTVRRKENRSGIEPTPVRLPV